MKYTTDIQGTRVGTLELGVYGIFGSSDSIGTSGKQKSDLFVLASCLVLEEIS